jgi:peptidyl-tRNA hydrolase, PTH1 family
VALKLIVGLGNPGTEYRRTRHNAGFWALDTFLERQKRSFTSKSGNALSTEFEIGGQSYRFMEPQTFMNRSGEAISLYMKKNGILSNELLVVHDEADLEPGRIQLKFGGGTGGHNGLESIVERLGRKDFWRIRIGVGKDTSKQLADYVLEVTSKEEMEKYGVHGADALEIVLSDGPERALNRVNAPEFQRNLPSPI